MQQNVAGSTAASEEKDRLCIMPKYVSKGIGIQTGKYDRELRRRYSVQSILNYSAQGVIDTGNVTAREGKTRCVLPPHTYPAKDYACRKA